MFWDRLFNKKEEEEINWTSAENTYDGSDWLVNKQRELELTEKTGLFGQRKENSAEFKAVDDALALLNGVLDEGLTANNRDRQLSLQMAFQGYQALIYSCDNYLHDKNGEARNAHSSVGKERLRIVSEIKALAENDMQGLIKQQFQSGDVAATTVREAIGKARTRQIHLDNKLTEHRQVGGNASTLHMLTGNETGGKDGFFQPNRIIYDDSRRSKEEAYQIAAYYSPLSKEEEETVKGILDENEKFGLSLSNWPLKLKDSDAYKNNERIKNFTDRLRVICKSYDAGSSVAYNKKQVGAISDSIKLTGRNVATSRVAQILDVGRMIAKSETVEMIDAGQESGIVGTLMEKAEGEEANDVLEAVFYEGLKNSDKEIKTKEDKFTSAEAMIREKMTGAMQRDLADLQVLDYICGQTDRHAGNFFIQKGENGMMTGLIGIDNDMSFGDALSNADNSREVVDDNGELLIPHMSRKMAESIAVLNDKMLEMVLQDLIEPAELAACLKRFRRVKNAVLKELGKPKGECRLLSDNEWNQNSMNDFMNAGGLEKIGNKKVMATDEDERKGSSNYVGRFINLFGTQALQRAKLKLSEQ